jgi:hypothetical protein
MSEAITPQYDTDRERILDTDGFSKVYDAGGRNRTCDLTLMKRLLLPLSYAG